MFMCVHVHMHMCMHGSVGICVHVHKCVALQRGALVTETSSSIALGKSSSKIIRTSCVLLSVGTKPQECQLLGWSQLLHPQAVAHRMHQGKPKTMRVVQGCVKKKQKVTW